MKYLIVGLAFLGLVACSQAPTDSPVLEEAFATAFDALTVYSETEGMSEEGVQFINATVNYSEHACSILNDPTLSTDERKLKLATDHDLTVFRADFVNSFGEVVASGELGPWGNFAVRRTMGIARRFVGDKGPEVWNGPCQIVDTFAAQWALTPQL